MPRTYTPNREKIYKKYDEMLIKQALKEYNNTNMSLEYISQKYNVSKSVLHRHNTVSVKKQGGQTALTENEEEHLIQHINAWYAERGHPLKTTDLRLFIKDYLDYLGVVIKRFKDNMPGLDYIHNFLKRNKSKISSSLSQNTTHSRLSPEVIKAYFDKLIISPQGIQDINLNRISEKSGPSNIIKSKNKFTKTSPQKISIDQKGKTVTRNNEFGNEMDNEKILNDSLNILPVQVKTIDNPINVNKTKIKTIKIIKMNRYNISDIQNYRTPFILLTKPLLKKPFIPPPNSHQQIDNSVKQNNYAKTTDSNQNSTKQNITTVPTAFDKIFTVQKEVKLSPLTKEEEKIEMQTNKENLVNKRAIIMKPIYLNKKIKIISVKKLVN